MSDYTSIPNRPRDLSTFTIDQLIRNDEWLAGSLTDVSNAQDFIAAVIQQWQAKSFVGKRTMDGVGSIGFAAGNDSSFTVLTHNWNTTSVRLIATLRTDGANSPPLGNCWVANNIGARTNNTIVVNGFRNGTITAAGTQAFDYFLIEV